MERSKQFRMVGDVYTILPFVDIAAAELIGCGFRVILCRCEHCRYIVYILAIWLKIPAFTDWQYINS